MRESAMPEPEKLKSILEYDPETGLFRYKQLTNPRRRGWFSGTRAVNGYMVITIEYKQYLAHRLAWLCIYGELPKGELDHINNNRSDNRISNLRMATRGQQSANSLRRSD